MDDGGWFSCDMSSEPLCDLRGLGLHGSSWLRDFRLHAARDQHGKRVARTTRADGNLHAGEPGVFHHRAQLAFFEAEPPVSKALAHPLLVVAPELQHEHAARRADDAERLA